jgi:hypothetical protein
LLIAALRVSLAAVLFSVLVLERVLLGASPDSDRSSDNGTRGAFVSRQSNQLRNKDRAPDEIRQRIGPLQIPFVKNEGQAESSVAFYTAIPQGSMLVTKKGEFVYTSQTVAERKRAVGSH